MKPSWSRRFGSAPRFFSSWKIEKLAGFGEDSSTCPNWLTKFSAVVLYLNFSRLRACRWSSFFAPGYQSISLKAGFFLVSAAKARLYSSSRILLCPMNCWFTFSFGAAFRRDFMSAIETPPFSRRIWKAVCPWLSVRSRFPPSWIRFKSWLNCFSSAL